MKFVYSYVENTEFYKKFLSFIINYSSSSEVGALSLSITPYKTKAKSKERIKAIYFPSYSHCMHSTARGKIKIRFKSILFKNFIDF